MIGKIGTRCCDGIKYSGNFYLVEVILSKPSLVPRLSPQKRGGGESLVTSRGKVVDFCRLGLGYQSDCRTKPHVHMTFCPLAKKLSTLK